MNPDAGVRIVRASARPTPAVSNDNLGETVELMIEV